MKKDFGLCFVMAAFIVYEAESTEDKKKVALDHVNELFGLSADDRLVMKDKIKMPSGSLDKMIHTYKGYEVFASTAVVAEDNDGFVRDAGTSGLAKNVDKLAGDLNFINPPVLEESLDACHEYATELSVEPIVAGTTLRHRYLYIYDRESDNPGPLVFADEVDVHGETNDSLPFSKICLYDATNRKIITAWDGIQTR